MPRRDSENIIEQVAHRLAQKLIPGIKAQRKFLTTPNPVGYKALTDGELAAMWNDPTGQGKEILRTNLPPAQFVKLADKMMRQQQPDGEEDFEI